MVEKKVLVADWLDKYGGAERVISKLDKIFTFNEAHVLVDLMSEENKSKIFNKKISITETSLRMISGKHFRKLLFFFPLFIRQIDFRERKDIELIISTSHSVCKSIKYNREKSLHISYFQARNMKYIWDECDLYFGKFKYLFWPFIKVLRNFDIKSASRPDFIVSNSNYVRDWVKEKYKIDSDVIYPPVDVEDFALETEKSDYYIAVGRIEPYKRFDIIVDAFNECGKKLIIVGDGSQFKKLKERSKDNITFTGYLEKDKIIELVSKAKCFMHGGLEDFGIALVEAQATGTPVIAYNGGGAKEIIVHGETGLLFDKQSKESVIDSLNKFDSICNKIDSKDVRMNSLRFSNSVFRDKIINYIESKKILKLNF